MMSEPWDHGGSSPDRRRTRPGVMTVYIETVGCQMNVLDSELVVASLRKRGLRAGRQSARGRHDPVQHVQRPPACRGQDLQRPGPAEARQTAQSRTRSSACSAAWRRRISKLIFERAPYVDLVVGPGQLHQMPELIEKIAAGEGPQLEVSLGPQGRQPRTKSSRASRASIRCAIRRCGRRRSRRIVRIMIGCDKFCTYCIVPSVRGRSRAGPASA